MNTKTIDMAHDADLRLSLQAMQRAARRARELAMQTGTAIVVSRDGVIEHIRPEPESTEAAIQEPSAPYGDKP